MNAELIAESRSHADSLRVVMQDQAAETIESLCSALETLQAEVKHLNLHLKATQSGRDAALARLAITEEANSMLLARNKWLEHTLAVAGASPVEPSESVEHRDELAKRKPEPAAETVGGLAKAVKAARGGDAPPAPMRRFA